MMKIDSSRGFRESSSKFRRLAKLPLRDPGLICPTYLLLAELFAPSSRATDDVMFVVCPAVELACGMK